MESPSGYICEDIMMEILSWLPPESLRRFKRVNKYWYNRIKHCIGDRDFVAKHLRNAKNNIFAPQLLFFGCLNFEKEQSFKVKENLCLLALFKNGIQSASHIRSVVRDLPTIPGDKKQAYEWYSHCNGVICLGDGFEFKLWNPALKEVKHVKPILPCCKWLRLVGTGFGYDPRGDDYKIVIMVRSSFRTDTKAMVYSLNSGCWTEIAFAVDFSEPLLEGVYCGEDCYWLTECPTSCNVMILCFNTISEKFYVIEVPYYDPRIPAVSRFDRNRLAVFDDNLALLSSSYLGRDSGVKVWIKHSSFRDGKRSYKWDQYSGISFRLGIAAPLVFWAINEILIECVDGGLLSFNFGSQSFRDVVINGKNRTSYFACPYLGSLVSIVKRAQGRLLT